MNPSSPSSASSVITTEQELLARTLYGEAEAYNRHDALAIACVIINRLRLGRWDNSIKAVCLQEHTAM
jgi:spore germination cell wall hydrolase CwlJ-like protein